MLSETQVKQYFLQILNNDELFNEYKSRFDEMLKSGDSQKLRECYSHTVVNNMFSEGKFNR